MNASDQPTASREVQLTSVVLVNIMAAMIAGAYALMRQGLDTTTMPETLKTLGLAWLLFNAPVFIHHWCIPANWRDRALFSTASLSLLTLAALAGAGWLVRFTGTSNQMVFWVPAGLGAALAAWHQLVWLVNRRIVWTVFFLIFAVVLGGTVGCMVYTNEFHHPLLIENLKQGLFPHNDTYFHAAAANMVELHGTGSTGLDGLVPLRYHVGSHWVFGLLAELVGVRIMSAYLLLFPVVIVSWFAFAILLLVQSCRTMLQGDERGHRNDVVFWLVFTIGFLGVLPLPVGSETYLCLSWTTTSESHLMSTTLLLLLVALCIHLYSILQRDERHSLTDLVAILGLVPVTLVLLSFTKISIPMVMLPVAAVALWRLRLYRNRVWLTSFILSGGLCALVFLGLFGFASHEQKSFPLAYVFYMIPRHWWGLFFPAMLFWVGWYAWSRLKQQGITTIHALRLAVRERRIVDVELLLLIVLISSAPAMLYSSFAVFFFWDYQRWIGFALVLGSLGCWSLRRKEECDAVATDAPRSMRLSTVFVCIVLACCLVTQGMNAYLSFKQYTLEMVQGRAATSEQAKALTEETNIAFRRFQIPQIVRLIRQATASRPGPLKRKTIDLLAELNRLPRLERKEGLLYIPKLNRDFWDQLPAGINRLFTCFLAPAISGLPQLDGVPEYDPAFDYYYATAWKYLGFADYHLENHRPPQKPWREDLPNLKKRTVEMGFKVLYIIDQNDKGDVYLERIPCQ